MIFGILVRSKGLYALFRINENKISMRHFKVIDVTCINISGIPKHWKQIIRRKIVSISEMFWTEPPFRVCSKWSWANLLFGINRKWVLPLRAAGIAWRSYLSCKWVQQRALQLNTGLELRDVDVECCSWELWRGDLKYGRPWEGGSPKSRFALKGGSVPKRKMLNKWKCEENALCYSYTKETFKNKWRT